MTQHDLNKYACAKNLSRILLPGYLEQQEFGNCTLQTFDSVYSQLYVDLGGQLLSIAALQESARLLLQPAKEISRPIRMSSRDELVVASLWANFLWNSVGENLVQEVQLWNVDESTGLSCELLLFKLHTGQEISFDCLTLSSAIIIGDRSRVFYLQSTGILKNERTVVLT